MPKRSHRVCIFAPSIKASSTNSRRRDMVDLSDQGMATSFRIGCILCTRYESGRPTPWKAKECKPCLRTPVKDVYGPYRDDGELALHPFTVAGHRKLIGITKLLRLERQMSLPSFVLAGRKSTRHRVNADSPSQVRTL